MPEESSGGFGDFLKSATEAFGNVYGAIKRPKTIKPDPNTAARQAAIEQSALTKYLLIGGAALLSIVLVLTLARK